jgi:hypothetical protein
MKKKIVEHYRTLTSVTEAVISWICTERPRGGRVFFRFCSTFKDSEDPIENIMRIMSLSRKDALKYLRDQEAILLTAIPSKRVVQHTDFYEEVPHEDQEMYAMMSDVEKRSYMEALVMMDREEGKD